MFVYVTDAIIFLPSCPLSNKAHVLSLQHAPSYTSKKIEVGCFCNCVWHFIYRHRAGGFTIIKLNGSCFINFNQYNFEEKIVIALMQAHIMIIKWQFNAAVN